jgi:tRNA (cmo5U34)-methyltransferase
LTEQKPQDRLYADARDQVSDFVFDAEVASVFPDMIQRSVPGYAAIINMIGLLTRMHAKAGTNLYDLGCSLGASSLSMARGLTHPDCRIVAVDNAAPMLERAREYTGDSPHPIDFLVGDIRDLALQNASVVVLNFTLQFLPCEDRETLLRRIRQALVPGGILILSEKIAGDTAQADQVLVEMHHAFKRAQGYSDLEISQKRSALENVLLPETAETHRRRLEQAGFARSDLWFQCFNFVSMVART